MGTAGKTVHGSAIIHTRVFGDALRKVTAGGARCLRPRSARWPAHCSTCRCAISMIPAPWTHLYSFPVHVADAPLPDDIMVVAAVADGRRPDARSA